MSEVTATASKLSLSTRSIVVYAGTFTTEPDTSPSDVTPAPSPLAITTQSEAALVLTGIVISFATSESLFNTAIVSHSSALVPVST